VNVRVAIVGCGRIAADHVASFRHAGADVVSVTARPGSANAPRFAGEVGIPLVHDSVERLAADPDWDLAVVAVPPESTVPVARRLTETGRPALIEKPGARRADDLEALRPWQDRVAVAYNRRFYRPVRRAAELLAAHGPAIVELVLPERSQGSPAASAERFVENSVHGIDLVLHLLGPLDILHADGASPARGAVAASARGDVVHVLMPWDSPDNMRLTIHWPGRRYELRPFEIGREYTALTVVEPCDATPIRTYQPVVEREDIVDATVKPGFAEQAAEVMARLGAPSGEPSEGILAGLDDAIAALGLAEAIVSGQPPG
jgi:predicted dehydrogenase